MYLSPADEERLRVFAAAELARRTLARGLRLNVPEAVALACDEMHLAARAGGSFGDVLAAGRRAVSPADLLPGVADLVDEIRLEVLLEDGSRLMVLRRPGRAGSDPAPGRAGWAERRPRAAPPHGTQRIGAAGPGVVSLPVLAGEPAAGVRPRVGPGAAARHPGGLFGALGPRRGEGDRAGALRR